MVTQAQIDVLQADFDKLMDDILVVVPHDHHLDMLQMYFHMLEGAALAVAKAQLVKSGKIA